MSKRPGDPGYAAGWCIHYRSPSEGETCEAGIRYDSFVGEARRMDRQPCFIKPGETAADRAPCPKLRPPTSEEIAAHKAWLAGRFDMLGVAFAWIADWRKAHRGKSAVDVVECPVCGGRLHVSISGRNGHVHGRCETAGCVQWME